MGSRQTTCSSPECQKARRSRNQFRWRQKNPSYQADYRLREQAKKLESGERQAEPMRGPPAEMSQVPWTFAKDEMGAQATVFIAFIVRLLMRSAKDSIGPKSTVITGEIGGHPLPVAKDQSDTERPACHVPP